MTASYRGTECRSTSNTISSLHEHCSGGMNEKYNRAVARFTLSTSLITPECLCNAFSWLGLTEKKTPHHHHPKKPQTNRKTNNQTTPLQEKKTKLTNQPKPQTHRTNKTGLLWLLKRFCTQTYYHRSMLREYATLSTGQRVAKPKSVGDKEGFTLEAKDLKCS